MDLRIDTGQIVTSRCVKIINQKTKYLIIDPPTQFIQFKFILVFVLKVPLDLTHLITRSDLPNGFQEKVFRFLIKEFFYKIISF